MKMKLEATMEIHPVLPNPSRHSAVGMSESLGRAFVSEMLKYAIPQPSETNFSGGIGEAQFASWMTNAQANLIANRLAAGGNFLE